MTAVALLLAIMFRFDYAPGGDIAGYTCHLWRLPSLAPVACPVWYDARWPRPSVFYAEAPEPGPGEALVGCVEAYDYSGNVSECEGWTPAPAAGGRRTIYQEESP